MVLISAYFGPNQTPSRKALVTEDLTNVAVVVAVAS